ncbi:MAG: response regulator [Bryobacteraceae bacterium]
MRELRILVADDHEIVRCGLRRLLEGQPGWTVVDEASNGSEAVDKAAEHQPDVVVLDISMPGLNGVEATRQIRAAHPNTEILVMTVHDSEQMALDLISAGARGYLTKADAANDLIAAVQALSKHGTYFNARVSDVLLNARGAGSSWPRRTLTPREREVLGLLAEGKTHREVATALRLSVRTVDSHCANIMDKLDLHSLGELIHYAIRHHIVAA